MQSSLGYSVLLCAAPETSASIMFFKLFTKLQLQLLFSADYVTILRTKNVYIKERMLELLENVSGLRF